MKSRHLKVGFTLVEIMIVISILILLAVIAIPSFIRSRQRTQASQTLNSVRLLDAAIDQWSIENGISDGAAIVLESLAVYVMRPSIMSDALENGGAPTDAIGNAFVFGLVGQGQVQVSQATKDALSGATTDWGPY